MMNKKKPVLFILLFSGLILLVFLLMQPLEILYGGDIAMLFPKGLIAIRERNLLLVIQGIMLLVVIPVYFLTFLFSWKYRADHPGAKYTPEWDDDKLAEYIWWGLPFVLTTIIAVLTFVRTYELDPYRPLPSEKKPLTIQVVALQWKWLFIYPEEKIATVNYFQFPENTPLHFEITADAPMNSFWIPEMGGQIYAMPSMKTDLYLIADKTGDFRGASANLSGTGFAGMHFLAQSRSDTAYQQWVEGAKKEKNGLDWSNYAALARPSENNPTATFRLEDTHLFHRILMKFMQPPKE